MEMSTIRIFRLIRTLTLLSLSLTLTSKSFIPPVFWGSGGKLAIVDPGSYHCNCCSAGKAVLRRSEPRKYCNRVVRTLFSKNNKIAVVLLWTGFSVIAAGIIAGIIIGDDDYERLWLVTFVYWVSGFLSGLFFIALSEIIEQLHKLNMKPNKEPEDDELILLND